MSKRMLRDLKVGIRLTRAEQKDLTPHIAADESLGMTIRRLALLHAQQLRSAPARRPEVEGSSLTGSR